jgi:hemolysin III
MKPISDVKIIEYPKKIDRWNTISHLSGVVFAVIGIFPIINKAQNTREVISVNIYMISFCAVYLISSIYHALPIGDKKRVARQLDHSTIPLLIAGTATPCAMITLYNVSMSHAVLVMTLGWACAIFGIISKLFFFEKLKKITMAVYIISGTIMLFSVIPIIDKIDKQGFMGLVYGCIFYVIGAIFCGLGAKKPVLHVVFHFLVLIGSIVQYSVILNFVL